jgi:hypothetical protein
MDGRRSISAWTRFDLGVVVHGLTAETVARYVILDRSQMDANALGVLALADTMATELSAAQKCSYSGRIAAQAARRYRHSDRVIG